MRADLDLESINKHSLANLKAILQSIYTPNNLLVLSSRLSKLIDGLTTFLNLKEYGKFQKSVWLEEFSLWRNVVDNYSSLIIVIDDDELDTLGEVVSSLKCKLNIVVKNLTRSSVYELNKTVGLQKENNLKAIVDLPKGSRSLKLTHRAKIFNWEVYPICLNALRKDGAGGTGEDTDTFLSLEMPYGGLHSYFHQPIEQVSKLSDAFIDLLKLSPQLNSTGKMFKLKNIYAKGDHSCLMVKILQDEKIPDFLNLQLTPLEQQVHLSKLKGNTDLIVLERNLDFTSTAFTQLNYQGLIDDLFDINMNQVVVDEAKNQKYVLDDELYTDLKHLNFGTIGPKLNQLTRAIQQEYLIDSSLSLTAIKNLVSNLGSLDNKGNLVEKHTELSESVMKYIEFGNISTNPALSAFNQTDELAVFLKFQNDIFDSDYKQHLTTLRDFITKCFLEKVILQTLILISIVNDGIKERDYDQVLEEVIQNFGINVKFSIDNLVKFNVIRVVRNSSTAGELLGALTSISIGNSGSKNTKSGVEDTNGSTINLGYEDLSKLGITGGQAGIKSAYSVDDSFFNLHPPVTEEDEQDREKKDGTLLSEYKDATFALPSSTVPILCRLVQSLYARDFLVSKPVNNLSRRANWDNLGLETMFQGKKLDINICDTLDEKRRRVNGNGNGAQINGSITSNALDFVIITVLGGITRGELSCLKYIEQKLNQDKNSRKKVFIILSSGLVNTSKLLEVCK